ncbi:HNH endonuclease [Cryobacterium sp. PH31-L1]|uniref:HNH endonuclease n=1 Tax=Cryobacterium sp. PH31-L1 TaxID=3046199 RepID=UPI0024B9D556|nr:HNH endonuclease [Cryobacterium sp. PH31-L1]MDJ0379148.1 hypothetical protein [Cryobacterium sp. PH31-L1]
MSVSSKTRKLLWSRAHNACAICRKSLTVDANSAESPGLILGEEAHIIAQREDGPRGRDGDRADIDGYDNLILLCADDHKRVDEQADVFTVSFLRSTKLNHEKWASDRFVGEPTAEPIRIVKAPDEDSVPLEALAKGQQIWDLLAGAGTRYLRTVESEVDPAATRASDALLDAAGGWSDISGAVQDRGFAAVREAQQALQELLDAVLVHGLVVCGRRVTRTITGGLAPPSPWPVAYLWVLTEAELRENSKIVEP